MINEHEQGWKALGQKLDDYAPKGDVGADFSAFKQQQAGPAPPVGGVAKLAASVGASTTSVYLFKLLALGLAVAAIVWVNTSDANLPGAPVAPPTIAVAPISSPANPPTDALGPESGTNPKAAAITAATVGTTSSAGTTSPASVSTPTKTEAVLPRGNSNLPDKLTTAAAVTASPIAPPPNSASQAVASRTDQNQLGSAVATSESIKATRTVPKAIRTLTGTRELMPDVLQSNKSTDENYNYLTITSDLVTGTSEEDKFSSARRGQWSVALGRQLNYGRNSKTNWRATGSQGFVEYVHPMGRKFGVGMRVGLSSYGSSSGEGTEHIERVDREYTTPLATKMLFRQLSYVDWAGSLDVALIGTYAALPRVNLHAGLCVSPTLYTVGLDDGGLPAFVQSFNDSARTSWGEFGGLVGADYRIYRRLSIEVSYAPTFTNPLQPRADSRMSANEVNFGKLNTSAVKFSIKYRL